jgi:trigger factor
MAKGEGKTFALTYPESYPDAELAGQEAEFTVQVNEVHEKQVPALDDALAQKISNGRYQTLDELRREMRADMERSLVARAEAEADNGLIDQILAQAAIKYPPVLVQSEVEDEGKALMARLEQQGVSLEDYLQRVGRTQEQLVAEWTAAAEKRIQIGLLLGKVAEAEGLSLTDADVEAALAERAGEERTTPAAVRAVLESNGGMEALRNRAQAKKVLDFLRASAIMEEKVVTADSAAEAEEDAADEAAETIEGGTE